MGPTQGLSDNVRICKAVKLVLCRKLRNLHTLRARRNVTCVKTSYLITE